MIQANASPDPTGLGRRCFLGAGRCTENILADAGEPAFYTKTEEKKRRNCQLKLAY